MRKSSILYFAIAVVSVASIQVLFDVFPEALLQPYSFISTWFLSAALLLASFGLSGFIGAYRAAVRGGDKAELGKAIAFFASAKRLLVATSVMCVILMAIEILRNLTGLEHIGTPLGLGLCSILYSAFGILFMVEPFRASAEKKLAELE